MFDQNRKFLYIIIGGVALIVIFIIILVIVLSGGNKKTANTATNTLTIWGTENTNNFNDLISNFQNDNDVKVTYVKKDPSTYLTDSLAEIAAGRGPDVWLVPSTYLAKYHNQMLAMPQNVIADKKAKKSDAEVYKSSFPDVIAEDNIIDGQIYGMPLGSDSLMLYLNSDILGNRFSELSSAGEVSSIDQKILTSGPANWDELVRAVQLLTQKSNGKITRSTVAMGTTNIANAIDILTLIMLQNGTQMTSADNNAAQFHTSTNVFGGSQFPGAKALSFYTSFANSRSANYTWSDTLGDSVTAFSQGKTAMMFGYKSQEADIKRINSNLQYQMINVPQITATKNPVNFASYSTLTVTRAAKNSALAWNFITSSAFDNSGSSAQGYLSASKHDPALISSISDESAPIMTAQSWFMPDPIKVPQIFMQMIRTVNSGANSQTAIESAASQVTALLQALK